jgi:hypothetical protein
VTHRVGMNAAIDDVDFGIRRHPESACWSTRSSKCLYRAASRPIARRLSEQFDATTHCRAAAYGGRLRSKVGRCGGRPAKQSVESGAAK